MAGAMDGIGNVAEAMAIFDVSGKTIGDDSYHQVTTGFDKTN